MFTFYPKPLVRYRTWTLFEKAFSADECKTIENMSFDYNANIPMAPDNEGNTVENIGYKNSTIRGVPWNDESDWIFQKLYALISEANDVWYKFDLNGIFEDLDIIQYDENGLMGWHADGLACGDYSKRKLSMSVQLSDASEYEGGNLELFVGETQIAPKEIGTLVIFPSYIYHQVTEVTKGTRKSMVIHAHGQPYR